MQLAVFFVCTCSTYRDKDNTPVITEFYRGPHLSVDPTLTVSWSRRLFRKLPTEGTLSFHLGAVLYLAVAVSAPTAFDLTSECRTQRRISRALRHQALSPD